MNEKIKELALQAGVIGESDWGDLNIELFTQLVAKECVHIVALNRAKAIEEATNVADAMAQVELDIEEMFGVE